MKRENMSWSGRLGLLVGLAAIGLLFNANEASAGCVVPGKAGSAPTGFVTAHAAIPPIQQSNDNGGQPATIVGMWHVVYTATYSTAGPIPVPVIPPGPPDSFVFLESMKTWHADGTEWEQKIQPAPTGYCFGVWTHAAQDTNKLHHFGTSNGPDGEAVAIFWMDEIDRVAPDGRTYTGTWDFRLFGPTDVFGTGPVLQEITGTMAATRIIVP
jgi:hypothetical protein